MRTLKDFVQKDWEPVCTSDPEVRNAKALQVHTYSKAHLIPAFGEFRLPDLAREAIQNFLLTKLREDYSWESVHHFRCALSKVLDSRRSGITSPTTQYERPHPGVRNGSDRRNGASSLGPIYLLFPRFLWVGIELGRGNLEGGGQPSSPFQSARRGHNSIKAASAESLCLAR
jgi:hypothetical protein